MTKLTLSVDEATVKKAKEIAEANGTSVSAMFRRFVQSIAARHGRSDDIGPLTRKVSGILTLPEGEDYKDLLTDALIEKHGAVE